MRVAHYSETGIGVTLHSQECKTHWVFGPEMSYTVSFSLMELSGPGMIGAVPSGEKLTSGH